MMVGQDLRSYLDLVKRRRADDFVIVSREVNPNYEITALAAKLDQSRKRPVVVFEHVKGTAFPVLTNLHASRSRLALAINAAPDEMLKTYLRAMETPIPPKIVATGPVQEVVKKGADVDLYALPQIVHHQGDAGPYITAAISFARDPEDERAIMGGLFGEPLELVKCETSDVLVPAHAEMVIEAEILPHERVDEGPFGEFTGYSLGQRKREV